MIKKKKKKKMFSGFEDKFCPGRWTYTLLFENEPPVSCFSKLLFLSEQISFHEHWFHDLCVESELSQALGAPVSWCLWCIPTGLAAPPTLLYISLGKRDSRILKSWLNDYMTEWQADLGKKGGKEERNPTLATGTSIAEWGAGSF